jgi:hypothetical protein
MKLQVRFKLAQGAGPKYSDLALMFEAASTADSTRLDALRMHDLHAVRFSTFCNPLTTVTSSDLKSDSLIKFAAVFNPSTTTEVLDEIGLNQTSLNPVIPETIHLHKNASQEFQVFRAITDIGINEELYEDETEMYFLEAIFDDGEVQSVIDLESLEALFYLYILGFIEAPSPTREFWEYFLDSEPKNFSQNIQLFGSLPAIPDTLYDQCETVVGARCLAGAWTKDQDLMRALVWDKQLVYTGVGGFYWQDSRSPRSSVAVNSDAPADLLRTIFQEEAADSTGLNDFPHPVLWRLTCNPSAPEDVLEGIISLIEQELVTDKDAQNELLVGEPDDFPYGLVTNPAVKGKLRERVEALMKAREMDPADYEINES